MPEVKSVSPEGSTRSRRFVSIWTKKAREERHEADEIRVENEKLEHETESVARRATFFDVAEICLEIGIVLNSIALLTKMALFWRLGFIRLAIGVGIAG